MQKNRMIKRKTNRTASNPDLEAVYQMWKDLSDQMACTQKSIANLRKDQKDAEITKKMLDYVLFGPTSKPKL